MYVCGLRARYRWACGVRGATTIIGPPALAEKARRGLQNFFDYCGDLEHLLRCISLAE